MSDAAAPAAAPAAAGPSNIDDPLERDKWIEEAIENDPVLVRRRDIIKVLSNESTAKMVLLDNTTAACEGGAAAGCGCQFPQRGCEARFHQWPPEKQRVLSCFSPAAAAALGGGGRAAPCWRPACLSGDVAEASVRVHHFGWHTFAPSSQLVDDDYASEWARARFPLR